MNESPSTVDDLLPQSVLERADRICDRFEDAWLAGRRPRIEDYLGDVPQGRQRDDLLEKLIAVDIFHRRKQGETPKPGDKGEVRVRNIRRWGRIMWIIKNLLDGRYGRAACYTAESHRLNCSAAWGNALIHEPQSA